MLLLLIYFKIIKPYVFKQDPLLLALQTLIVNGYSDKLHKSCSKQQLPLFITHLTASATNAVFVWMKPWCVWIYQSARANYIATWLFHQINSHVRNSVWCSNDAEQSYACARDYDRFWCDWFEVLTNGSKYAKARAARRLMFGVWITLSSCLLC